MEMRMHHMARGRKSERQGGVGWRKVRVQDVRQPLSAATRRGWFGDECLPQGLVLRGVVVGASLVAPLPALTASLFPIVVGPGGGRRGFHHYVIRLSLSRRESPTPGSTDTRLNIDM